MKVIITTESDDGTAITRTYPRVHDAGATMRDDLLYDKDGVLTGSIVDLTFMTQTDETGTYCYVTQPEENH